MIITMEGIDGVGKSTQVELLRKALEGMGYRVATYYEPGGTPMGRKIRELIMGGTPCNQGTTLLLYMASMIDLVNVLMDDPSEIIIVDRFIHSTIAYSTYDSDFIMDIWDTMTHHYYPYFTILLDMEVEEALGRIGVLDHRELVMRESMNEVRRKYLSMLGNNRIGKVIDASQSVDVVSREILSLVLPRLSPPVTLEA